MSILVVLINIGNYVSQYVLQMMEVMNRIGRQKKAGTKVDYTILGEYPGTNQDSYDAIIYNTFPDETHRRKFDRELTARCDEKFHSFQGIKILLDSHDNGTKDGFARFGDFRTPRIKANPSYEIMQKMNLIMSVPYIVYPIYCHPQKERPNQIVCAMRISNMPPCRRETLDRIRHYKPLSEWLPLSEHAQRLCRTLINVVPTGNGDSSRSHVDTLAAGALLLAEENIQHIKVLPYMDLEDDRNFVSYNLENICDKLDYLLGDYARTTSIRMAGLDAFKKGYDVDRSANQLLDWLEAA